MSARPSLKRSSQYPSSQSSVSSKRGATSEYKTNAPFRPRSTVRGSSVRRVEVKTRSSNPTSSTALISAGTIYPLCTQIYLGDDYNERDGRVVKLIAVAWTIKCDLPANVALNVVQWYRAIVFSWSDNSTDNPPVVSDILDAANIYSQYAIPTVSQYKIYSDKLYEMKQTATTVQAVSRFDRGKVKLNLVQDYPSGANPECVKNGLYILLIADFANTGFNTTSKAQVLFVNE